MARFERRVQPAPLAQLHIKGQAFADECASLRVVTTPDRQLPQPAQRDGQASQLVDASEDGSAFDVHRLRAFDIACVLDDIAKIEQRQGQPPWVAYLAEDSHRFGDKRPCGHVLFAHACDDA